MKKEIISNLVGAKIESFRKKRKYSQERLAESVGLKRTSIVNIEKGRHLPSLFLMYRLAEALKEDISALLPLSQEIVNYDPIEQFAIDNDLNKKQLKSVRELISKSKT